MKIMTEIEYGVQADIALRSGHHRLAFNVMLDGGRKWSIGGNETVSGCVFSFFPLLYDKKKN